MEIYGFELIKEQEIPEINSKVKLFRHMKTGAELLSVENDDENKVFGITLRTPPPDSTGLPHIMEHSVLCGSSKYPVKEPFVELMKGSQATFLNAFTYPDKTCYPVASQNLQDFYNLIDVYVDAVFHPLIPAETLQQEGWHYELDDPEQPVAYKGVVFNEMKGAYSSPESVLYREIQHSLFPDNAYGVDSGGDPRKIPDLTYEQFKRFHEKYYHPSNAFIYFYGDDDPDRRLELMDEYLQPYSRIEVESAIAIQPTFGGPRRLQLPYAAGEEEEKKTYLTVNWMLGETCDPYETLALSILNHILIGTPASPLRKALIDSGLGEDIAGMGMELDLRQAIFSTGLKGIATEDAGKVEDLVRKTLEDLVVNRIDPEMIAASMNTVEFRLRERNTGSFPRGLALMLASLMTWLHGGDPFTPLAFEGPLQTIKSQLASGDRVFEGLMDRFLLRNPHQTILLLEPDPELEQRMEEEEKQRLQKVQSELSREELLELVENTRKLRERQERPDSPEALSTIPSLELSDLEKEVRKIPLEILEHGGDKILYHDLFTNGIVYLDLGFNLRRLPQEMLPYISLFGRALLEMGTETEDFVRLAIRIGQKTGGIRPASLTTLHRTSRESLAWLFLRGKSTTEQAADLLGILKDVLLTMNLDNQERFRQMVLEEKADMEASLIPAGTRYVNTRLRARFDQAGYAAEKMGGIDYLYFLRQLASDVSQDWPKVLENLEAVRRALINQGGVIANVTLDTDNWKNFEGLLKDFMQKLPTGSAPAAEWQPAKYPSAEGLTIPAQVNYVGKGANLFDLGYRLDGSMFVISKYVNSTYMWEKVRVQGGAYGASFSFDNRSGVLTYLSYRDPNLLQTLEVYGKTSEFLRKLDLSDEELTKTIVGTIGDMDAYQLPDAKGFTSLVRYLVGDTDEYRQEVRDQVLSTNSSDFHALADVLARAEEQGQVAVLGSADAIQKVNEELSGWLQIQKVL